MKNIIRFFTILILSIGSFSILYGQDEKTPCLDTIRILIEDKIELTLAVCDFKTISDSIEKDLKRLQVILQQDHSFIQGNNAYSMTYEPNKSLTVKQIVPVIKVVLENEKQIKFQFNYQCSIIAENYFLEIRFNKLEELLSDTLIKKIREVITATIPINYRKKATYNFSIQSNNLTHNKQLDKINEYCNEIQLLVGIGVSLIKNQPVTDISSGIAVTIRKNQFYVSDNLFYLLDDNQNVKLSNFINIGYKYNFSNSRKEEDWFGMEIGYLTYRDGSFFDENTFKFGLTWDIAKNLSASTQLFFFDNFKMIYPAIRIGFAF